MIRLLLLLLVLTGVALAAGVNDYPAGEPGETTPLPRPYEMAPPLIPHTLDGYGYSRLSNDCIDCHLTADEVEEGHVATRIPDSHRVNPFTGESSEGGVVGNRYACTQCHVPQSVSE